MLARFGSHRSGAEHPDETPAIQFVQIDIQLSEGGEEKGEEESERKSEK